MELCVSCLKLLSRLQLFNVPASQVPDFGSQYHTDGFLFILFAVVAVYWLFVVGFLHSELLCVQKPWVQQ